MNDKCLLSSLEIVSGNKKEIFLKLLKVGFLCSLYLTVIGANYTTLKIACLMSSGNDNVMFLPCLLYLIKLSHTTETGFKPVV